MDTGAPAKADPEQSATLGGQVDSRANDLLLLMRTYTPADKNSPLAVYLPGFTSLRLLLEMRSKSPREEELAQTLVESYSSYCQSGRTPSDVAWMVARDYMLLSQHQQPQQHQQLSQQAAHRASFPTSSQTQAHSAGLQGHHNANISMQPTSNQQMYSSAPAPHGLTSNQQQQVVPLALQQLTQNYDFSLQLPGQRSA